MKIFKACLFFSLIMCLGSTHVNSSEEKANRVSKMTIESADIKAGEQLNISQVFNGFGCSGKNLSPQLSWQNVPAEAKSLAITVYDPDAPTGSGWWHWVAFNIPVNVDSLPAGASLKDMPENAVESMTDYGKKGFGGACPPKGDKPHRYIFTVWALDVESLPLDSQSPAAMVGYFLHKHAVESAKLEAVYSH